MLIPITLEPRQAAELREALIRKDKDAVRALLTKALEQTIAELLGEPPPPLTDEEFEALLAEADEIWLEAGGEQVPALSDEAVSREGIYGDHP
jgi:antitoxin ParD1/3/4